jgi:Zn-dependent protease with chaperone function
MKNDYLERQLSVIEDNDNVEKTSEIGNFFVLISGIVGIFLAIVLSLSFLAEIFIDIMPTTMKCKIEDALSNLVVINKQTDAKYSEQKQQLEYLKKIIIKNDKDLKAYSNIKIEIVKSKEYNAWVFPNGEINFTTTLLNENFSQEELTFILAHEIGHYKNSDALKSISKDVISMAAASILGSDMGVNAGAIIQNASFFEKISYSKNKERKADKYATKMLKKIKKVTLFTICS